MIRSVKRDGCGGCESEGVECQLYELAVYLRLPIKSLPNIWFPSLNLKCIKWSYISDFIEYLQPLWNQYVVKNLTIICIINIVIWDWNVMKRSVFRYIQHPWKKCRCVVDHMKFCGMMSAGLLLGVGGVTEGCFCIYVFNYELVREKNGRYYTSGVSMFNIKCRNLLLLIFHPNRRVVNI